MSNPNSKSSLLATVVAVAGAFAIMAVLVNSMKRHSAAPPADERRAQERSKALSEVRAAAEKDLNSHGVLDAGKGLYRLKVSQAVALTEQMYRNPAEARKNLIERAEKANFVPPPPTFE